MIEELQKVSELRDRPGARYIFNFFDPMFKFWRGFFPPGYFFTEIPDVSSLVINAMTQLLSMLTS